MRNNDELSARERQVAHLVARGMSNKEVARELNISSGTVKLHVHNVLRKINVSSRYHVMVRFNHEKEAEYRDARPGSRTLPR